MLGGIKMISKEFFGRNTSGDGHQCLEYPSSIVPGEKWRNLSYYHRLQDVFFYCVVSIIFIIIELAILQI